MDKWINYTFESSSYATPEFNAFARDFKRELKRQLEAKGIELLSWSKGHFDCSGFARQDDKHVYFSISDVRHFGDWHTNILIRTAEHPKDYRGGANNNTVLRDFGEDVSKLITKVHVTV